MKTHTPIHAITIGSFDGLHLAHQKLISQADMLVVIERNGGYLTPGYKRSHFTDKPITFYGFDKIQSLSPEAFIRKLKRDFPALHTIVVGYDFHFGKAKAGNAETLKALFDGDVTIVKEVCQEGTPVHSKTIKKLLREGKLALANTLLGRSYQIDGTIIQGQGLGGKSLVPTLNLHTSHYQLPIEGVYATQSKVDGMWLPSISFLGHRLTTDGSFAIETHILDQEVHPSAQAVSISFVSFIRSNQKFESLAALKQQIASDISHARRVLS